MKVKLNSLLVSPINTSVPPEEIQCNPDPKMSVSWLGGPSRLFSLTMPDNAHM
jgi:hypothetical protein